MQSAMEIKLSRVSTAVFSLPLTKSSKSRAVPPIRPGPCTEDGSTYTTSTPSRSAASRIARSASYFERSYSERNEPR